MEQATPGQIKRFFETFWEKYEKHNWSKEWIQNLFSSGALSKLLDVKNPEEIDLELLEEALGLPKSSLEIEVTVCYMFDSSEFPRIGYRQSYIPKKTRSRKEILKIVPFEMKIDNKDVNFLEVFWNQVEKTKAFGCYFCALALEKNSDIIPKSFEKYHLIFPGLVNKEGKIGILSFIKERKSWILFGADVEKDLPGFFTVTSPEKCRFVKVLTDEDILDSSIHSSGRIGSTFDGA